MAFPPEVAEELLAKSGRRCCLCCKFAGQKMEIHHIDPRASNGPDTFDNGIPLCFDCHADMGAYNNAHPRGRKYRPTELRRHRNRVFKLVEEGRLTIEPDRTFDDDVSLLRFFSECFDRPAFQDEIRQEGSMEDFDRAMEDTITAINTGGLRSRDGHVLRSVKGKSHLHNADWRNVMDEIVDKLRLIRSRYATAVKSGDVHLGPDDHDGERFYCFHGHELSDLLDRTRAEIIDAFNRLCEEAGLPGLEFPRDRWRH